MFPKRPLREEGGGDGDSGNQNKRRLFSSILRAERNVRNPQEYMSFFEPFFRKWVQEEVGHAVNRVFRPSSSGIQYSGSRTLQLRFGSKLPDTLFTGSRVTSEDGSPIRLILCDSISNEIVTSGASSSAKVDIVALDGDFNPDDLEGWSMEDFDRNIVQNREGKRPLLTGELTVTLQNGVGEIGLVSFTDNSSWMRSRKFRLGAKVHLLTDEISIREAMSNRFKTLDHRGESYQKHYPPSLDDEVWRLERIAKDGIFHKKLTECGVSCVRDFLRLNETNQPFLRDVLGTISKRTWEIIIKHATSCTLDDKKYMYFAAQGTELFFNSIFKVVGMRFTGQSYRPVDTLDSPLMRMVEALKQPAYRNMKDWILVCDSPYVALPTLPENPTETFSHPNFGLQDMNFHVEQDQPETQMSNYQPTMSSSYDDCDVDQDRGHFEIGESQGFNPAFRNSFGIGMSAYSPGMFCERNWTPGGIYLGSPLSAGDLPVNHFRGDTSAWQGNGLFTDSNNYEIGTASSNPAIIIPKMLTPRTRWCKLLSVVKWRILVKRSVAARKWKQIFDR